MYRIKTCTDVNGFTYYRAQKRFLFFWYSLSYYGKSDPWSTTGDYKRFSSKWDARDCILEDFEKNLKII